MVSAVHICAHRKVEKKAAQEKKENKNYIKVEGNRTRPAASCGFGTRVPIFDLQSHQRPMAHAENVSSIFVSVS